MFRKVFCLIFICLATNLCWANDKIIIVIDAGHGGKDPGNISSQKNLKQEKELNLIIAKKVGSFIKKHLTNIEILYTREDDTYPSLTDRVELANGKKANYFLSIHCNDSENKDIRGTESHVHNWLSRKSVEWAKIMEEEFVNRAGRISRGIKTTDDREHSLQVLKHTDMTSLLVECGFMSNDKEARYLNTAYGQEIIASAIFRAFRSVVQSQYPKINILPNSEKAEDKKNEDKKEESPSTKNDKEKITYSIQIHSSKSKIDTEDEIFKNLEEKVKRKELINSTNGYKFYYLLGEFKTKVEAEKCLVNARKKGFKDAFIVTIKDAG